MAKTLTIRIKPVGEAMETFRKTFRALEGSTRSTTRAQRSEGVFFTSIEAARKLLTPNRLALLRAIRTERPGSMYALARRIGRDLKNVQQDLKLLESYGLVRLARSRRAGKGRRTKAPQALFREIALKIAI
jgi:predicted transcriptional regulator